MVECVPVFRPLVASPSAQLEAQHHAAVPYHWDLVSLDVLAKCFAGPDHLVAALACRQVVVQASTFPE